VIVKSDYLTVILTYFIKMRRETAFNYLADLTAVDYYDYF